MENKKVDRQIDLIGYYCPEPVFRLRKELDSMEVGQVVELLGDDPASLEDIPALCKRTNQECLEILNEGDHYRFFVKKVV